MKIRYKYTTTMPIVIKTKDQFLHDFFNSKRFQEFLHGRIMLWVSPIYDTTKWQICLDIDIKNTNISKKTMYRKLKNLKTKLNLLYGHNTFNIENAFTGFHFVSTLYYDFSSFGNILNFKSKIKSLFNNDILYEKFIEYTDIHTIMRDNPIKRIGYDTNNRRIYYPIISDEYFNISYELKLEPIEIYSKNFWEKYIKNNLFIKRKITRMQVINIFKMFANLF